MDTLFCSQSDAKKRIHAYGHVNYEFKWFLFVFQLGAKPSNFGGPILAV
jgi:hypothetical protein